MEQTRMLKKVIACVVAITLVVYPAVPNGLTASQDLSALKEWLKYREDPMTRGKYFAGMQDEINTLADQWQKAKQQGDESKLKDLETQLVEKNRLLSETMRNFESSLNTFVDSYIKEKKAPLSQEEQYFIDNYRKLLIENADIADAERKYYLSAPQQRFDQAESRRSADALRKLIEEEQQKQQKATEDYLKTPEGQRQQQEALRQLQEQKAWEEEMKWRDDIGLLKQQQIDAWKKEAGDKADALVNQLQAVHPDLQKDQAQALAKLIADNFNSGTQFYIATKDIGEGAVKIPKGALVVNHQGQFQYILPPTDQKGWVLNAPRQDKDGKTILFGPTAEYKQSADGQVTVDKWRIGSWKSDGSYGDQNYTLYENDNQIGNTKITPPPTQEELNILQKAPGKGFAALLGLGEGVAHQLTGSEHALLQAQANHLKANELTPERINDVLAEIEKNPAAQKELDQRAANARAAMYLKYLIDQGAVILDGNGDIAYPPPGFARDQLQNKLAELSDPANLPTNDPDQKEYLQDLRVSALMTNFGTGTSKNFGIATLEQLGTAILALAITRGRPIGMAVNTYYGYQFVKDAPHIIDSALEGDPEAIGSILAGLGLIGVEFGIHKLPQTKTPPGPPPDITTTTHPSLLKWQEAGQKAGQWWDGVRNRWQSGPKPEISPGEFMRPVEPTPAKVSPVPERAPVSPGEKPPVDSKAQTLRPAKPDDTVNIHLSDDVQMLRNLASDILDNAVQKRNDIKRQQNEMFDKQEINPGKARLLKDEMSKADYAISYMTDLIDDINSMNDLIAEKNAILNRLHQMDQPGSPKAPELESLKNHFRQRLSEIDAALNETQLKINFGKGDIPLILDQVPGLNPAPASPRSTPSAAPDRTPVVEKLPPITNLEKTPAGGGPSPSSIERTPLGGGPSPSVAQPKPVPTLEKTPLGGGAQAGPSTKSIPVLEQTPPIDVAPSHLTQTPPLSIKSTKPKTTAPSTPAERVSPAEQLAREGTLQLQERLNAMKKALEKAKEGDLGNPELAADISRMDNQINMMSRELLRRDQAASKAADQASIESTELLQDRLNSMKKQLQKAKDQGVSSDDLSNMQRQIDIAQSKLSKRQIADLSKTGPIPDVSKTPPASTKLYSHPAAAVIALFPSLMEAMSKMTPGEISLSVGVLTTGILGILGPWLGPKLKAWFKSQASQKPQKVPAGLRPEQPTSVKPQPKAEMPSVGEGQIVPEAQPKARPAPSRAQAQQLAQDALQLNTELNQINQVIAKLNNKDAITNTDLTGIQGVPDGGIHIYNPTDAGYAPWAKALIQEFTKRQQKLQNQIKELNIKRVEVNRQFGDLMEQLEGPQQPSASPGPGLDLVESTPPPPRPSGPGTKLYSHPAAAIMAMTPAILDALTKLTPTEILVGVGLMSTALITFLMSRLKPKMKSMMKNRSLPIIEPETIRPVLPEGMDAAHIAKMINTGMTSERPGHSFGVGTKYYLESPPEIQAGIRQHLMNVMTPELFAKTMQRMKQVGLLQQLFNDNPSTVESLHKGLTLMDAQKHPSFTNLLKLGLDENIPAHGTADMHTFMQIILDGKIDSAFFGTLTRGDPTYTAGPHGPYYVVVERGPNWQKSSNHAAYVVPDVIAKNFLLKMLDEAVKNNIIDGNSAKNIRNKIVTYDDFVRNPNSPGRAPSGDQSSVPTQPDLMSKLYDSIQKKGDVRSSDGKRVYTPQDVIDRIQTSIKNIRDSGAESVHPDWMTNIPNAWRQQAIPLLQLEALFNQIKSKGNIKSTDGKNVYSPQDVINRIQDVMNKGKDINTVPGYWRQAVDKILNQGKQKQVPSPGDKMSMAPGTPGVGTPSVTQPTITDLDSFPTMVAMAPQQPGSPFGPQTMTDVLLAPPGLGPPLTPTQPAGPQPPGTTSPPSTVSPQAPGLPTTSPTPSPGMPGALLPPPSTQPTPTGPLQPAAPLPPFVTGSPVPKQASSPGPSIQSVPSSVPSPPAGTQPPPGAKAPPGQSICYVIKSIPKTPVA